MQGLNHWMPAWKSASIKANIVSDDRMKDYLRLDLLEYSIQDDEIFVFEYNTKVCNGVFSICDLEKGQLLRQIVSTNVPRENYISKIDELTKKYQKVKN